MKINIDRIPDAGLRLAEPRPPEWWTNFSELLSGEEDGFDGPVEVDLFIQRSGAQIHVKGTISARVKAQCSRCLVRVTCEIKAPVDVFLVPERPGMSASDMDEGYETYHGENIDLAEHIRGQLALHFPSRFYCREDCKGLCPNCGVNLNTGECSCSKKKSDPRWDALKKLKFS